MYKLLIVICSYKHVQFAIYGNFSLNPLFHDAKTLFITLVL